MIHIGSFQAKTHFSEVLRRVEQGEEFCITNRGRVVAILIFPGTSRKAKSLEAFGRLQALRKKHPVGSTQEILRWKDIGRK